MHAALALLKGIKEQPRTTSRSGNIKTEPGESRKHEGIAIKGIRNKKKKSWKEKSKKERTRQIVRTLVGVARGGGKEEI